MTVYEDDEDEAVDIWTRPRRIAAGATGRAAARPTTTGGRTPPAPPGRPRRSSWTADRATAPTAAPTSTRSASARSGTTCSCSTRSTASARCSATAEQEHRHGLVGRARRDGVAGQGELLRDRSVRPAARRGAVPVGQASTAPTSSTTCRDQDRSREHGASDGVPGRRRGAAVERGTRLHPAADAPPCGLARRGVWASQREVFRPLVASVVEGFGDAYPELRENAAFIEEVLASEEERFSATLRQGMVLFDEARDRARDGVGRGRRRVQAVRHVRVPDRADDRARGRRRAAGRRGSVPRVCCRSRGTGRGRRPRRWRSGWTPARCRRRVRRATSSPRRRSPIALLLERRERTSSRSPRRARRCGCSWIARRSTRRAAVRSGTTA